MASRNGRSRDRKLYADADDKTKKAFEEGKLYTGELDLVGTWEGAIIIGVERSRMARWLEEQERTGREKIPAPVARLKCGPVWRRKDLEDARPAILARRQREGAAA